ncbi:MAG: outer membrane beta-barrel protein [Terriglobia bacterium]
MKTDYFKFAAVIALFFGLANVGYAQTAPATPTTEQKPAPDAKPADEPAPAPLSTPSMTGPLSGLPPVTFDAGPLGKLAVNGIISGTGLYQGGYRAASNQSQQATLSNGQVWIQKTDGWWQFYVQAGAYNILSLGTSYLEADQAISNLFGGLPVGYLKLQPGKNTSILIGALPTLIGAEYTFSFQNMHVQRGLLWNQENAVTRGVQINQTLGKVNLSFSYGDGFYSNRYSWLTGLISYTSGPHSIAFVGGGNLSQTKFQTFATPVQNNGSIYNVIYTFTKGPWIIQPYYQYTSVPTNPAIGVVNGAATQSGAILATYKMNNGFSFSGRWEYISSSGSVAQESVNLLNGPGSSAWSITASPTYQKGGFFVRGDLSYVQASSYLPGYAFGPSGDNPNQLRMVGEIGIIFGENIFGKK